MVAGRRTGAGTNAVDALEKEDGEKARGLVESGADVHPGTTLDEWKATESGMLSFVYFHHALLFTRTGHEDLRCRCHLYRLTPLVAYHGFADWVGTDGTKYLGNVPNNYTGPSPIRLILDIGSVKGASNPGLFCALSA
ncbi:uncharacterized protein BXZ73DRAFT_104903 [Epithele typhae]|uniref:uncharacterized protein n=1 Tax=Epithele typhae TaxID=378194 RepID=UPI002008333C|nr:uncharacterized protein BXZ73DRAFT_104903 [Epithele typhae]KAH9919794.1 hypothetical protein BXZ73DRAFT_104903 [Epithele typhae]